MTTATEPHPFHPVADAFPMMSDEELADLAADIAANGLHVPIVLDTDGRILDGRNRYLACKASKVRPKFTVYTGLDPATFAASMNLSRRHLEASQRAMIAAKLAKLRQGRRRKQTSGSPALSEDGRPKKDPETTPTIDEAAKLLGVSANAVARARHVLTTGIPDLVLAVEDGSVSMDAAAEVASLPTEVQEEVVAQGPAAITRKAVEQRSAKAEASANFDPDADLDEPWEKWGGWMLEMQRTLATAPVECFSDMKPNRRERVAAEIDQRAIALRDLHDRLLHKCPDPARAAQETT